MPESPPEPVGREPDESLATSTADRRIAAPVAVKGDSGWVLKLLLGILLATAVGVVAFHKVGRGRWARGTPGGPDEALAEEPVRSSNHLLSPGVTDLDPSEARIGTRLVSLVAVAERALAEFGNQTTPETGDAITGWVGAARADDELEDHEEEILIRPPGMLHDLELAYGSWQIEGAAVLGWALHLLDELPPHDEAVDPRLVSEMLGLPDAERTLAVLRSGSRRDAALVDTETDRYQGIYRRLQDQADAYERPDGLPPSLPLGSANPPPIDGGLTVGGRPIGEAEPDVLDIALTITAQRLHALHWLRRGGRYSAIDLEA